MTGINLDHVQAVKARIEEIRRKFVDVNEQYDTGISSTGRDFKSVLSNVKDDLCVPKCPSDLEPMIKRAADKYGIDSSVIKAVIKAESGFRPNATSRVGAQGLMQLMPGTARALGVDASDPEQNIDGGTKYLKQQLDKFGSLDLALAAYNAGPGSVVKYGGVPPYTETQNYVQQVMRNAQVYASE